ncbi:DUF3108 domain-containing protein [Thiomicrorhabdus aquaedulcis]|uniref:DUF3108 domain-containing protein n=1 Tax=Thiomicrorhabdus aquaedulcis TaxID=2211106 RepID=UPI000FDAA03D|nr:DUF3108 domain-containing protein [Thiomicrorhabdus aquaedulcis]
MAKTTFTLQFFYTFLVSVISLHSVLAYAEPLTNFNATFSVHAFGVTLGQSNQSLRCNAQQCTLISDTRPTGWARAFVSEYSVETIKLTQTNNTLTWLQYQKMGVFTEDGIEQKKWVTLQRDAQNGRILYTEKNRTWPEQTALYDIISLVYAMQHAKLNQQPLTQFYVQDTNFQDKIVFKTLDQASFIDLDFSKSPVNSLHYAFETQGAKIDVWLLPTLRYFPGKIRVENKKENHTITLNLLQNPTFL